MNLRPLALALLVVLGCKGNQPTPVAMPPSICEVARPIEREVTDYQVFTARTQAIENVDIKARVTGYVLKIPFADGSLIKSGDILFQLDDRPYKAILDKAKADVEFAKASQVKAKAFYDIGLAVQKENKAAISQQELDRRRGALEESVAQVKQAQATQDSAQINFDWCTVRSPIDGRVNQHMVDVGALVSENITQLTNVVSIKPIWAYFDVDQNSALRYEQLVKEGKVKSARVTTIPLQMALAADQAFTIAGHVDFVANQLDPNTGSIRLRGVFENTDGGISSGLFARVRLPRSAPHSALLVSDRALGTDQGQTFLLVLNDKNEVEYRAVEIGQLHDGLREVMRTRKILEPGSNNTQTFKEVEVLKATDRVIVSGLQRVRPGDKAEPKLVDMQTRLVK